MAVTMKLILKAAQRSFNRLFFPRKVSRVQNKVKHLKAPLHRVKRTVLPSNKTTASELSDKGVVGREGNGVTWYSRNIACPDEDDGTVTSRAAVMYLLGNGYYLLDGLKYGGDFVAYDRHPSENHSKYLVVVCPETAPLAKDRLAAYIRQAQSLNKSLLLIGTSHMTDTSSCLYPLLPPTCPPRSRSSLLESLNKLLLQHNRRLRVAAVTYKRGFKG
eukprot:TRINITY_DN2474_c3_g1_i1.p1 TRINITY_DN2474_c3_g1~~TRINITY_DN2474_c3_g1_i1.p1  ORF type:complete len:217 (+),score=30.86 TRINITY_DN2474_c3_g1_i1:65-715(+)